MFSVLIVAGCGSLVDLKASSEVIKQFLNENPNADITMNTWSADDVRDNQDKITLICGKMLEEKPYYYVLIEEEEQRIEAFLDFDTGKAICVKRVGLKDDIYECSDLNVEQCRERSDCEIVYGPSVCQPNGLCTADIVPKGCKDRQDNKEIYCGNGVCEDSEKKAGYCKIYYDAMEKCKQEGQVCLFEPMPEECQNYCPKDCGEIIEVPQEKITEEQAIELVKKYFHKQWYQVADGCGSYNEKTGMMEPLKIYIKETLEEGGRTTYLVYLETYCGWNYNTGSPTIIRYSVTVNGEVKEEGPIKTEPAPAKEIVSETIKCVFKNSKEKQKCYSEEFYCSGTEACNVEVKGESGKTLTWKSSCGGYAYITLDGTGNYDGRGEYAEFECGSSTTPSQCSDYRNPVCGVDGETYQNICVAESKNVKISYYGECENAVSEKVTCIFAHPSLENKCYSVDGLWSCSGEEKCDAYVKGGKETKITWKSRCTETRDGQATYGVGYADTVVDGEDETASFACTINTQVIIE